MFFKRYNLNKMITSRVDRRLPNFIVDLNVIPFVIERAACLQVEHFLYYMT